MQIEKKYLKLGVAGLAVTALVIGLSVGLTQRNKSSAANAAAAAQKNTNVASDPSAKDYEEYCYYGKSGKSGATGVGKSGKSGGRMLFVPGTEDFVDEADERAELRAELMRGLAGTDDGDMGAAAATYSNGNNGNGNGNRNKNKNGNKKNKKNKNKNKGNPGKKGNNGNGNPKVARTEVRPNAANKRPNGAQGLGNPLNDPTYSPTAWPTYNPTAAGDYDYYDYDYDYDYYYSGKSGKSGNKSGKSGNKSGKSGAEQCFLYDPCDPSSWPKNTYGKSGKSGARGAGKSGKSGVSDQKQGNKNPGKKGNGKKPGKKDGHDYYYDYDYDYYYSGKSGKSGNKSGKSGSYPFCPCGGHHGKSGKSGNKSGKSGNKSGKSGNKSGKSGRPYECDLSCLPTLCPGTLAPSAAPCVCEALPVAFSGGKCVRKCGVSENGNYANIQGCCQQNFPFSSTCQIDDCGVTPPCVCEDLPFTLVNGQCTRDCAIDYTGRTAYATEGECCEAEFPGGGCAINDCGNAQPTVSPTYSPTATPPTYAPTATPVAEACSCENLPYAFVNGQCSRGCGISENGIFFTLGECCATIFPNGGCVTNDECPVPTPAPTQGSTPTVSTEVTGPPTKGSRSNEVV